LGLKEITRYYVEYQKSVERKRVRFDLEQAKARAHILEGLVIAVNNIDKVIKIIRSSKNTTEARDRLRSTFELSEKQAQAILDMRLARLTALEIENLKKELSELQALIAELEAILGSEKKLLAVIKESLLAIKRKFKDPRRTVILLKETEKQPDHEEALKVVEENVVALDASGNAKRINAKSFSRSNSDVIPDNASELSTILIKTKSDSKLLVFTDKGNYYTVACEDIPECKWKDKGAPLSLIGGPASDESVVAAFDEQEVKGILNFYTESGMIKRTEANEYAATRKGKIQAISLKDNDRLIKVEPDSDALDKVICITQKGNSLVFAKAEAAVTGRATQGVKAINLDSDDKVCYAGQVSDEGEMVLITDRGFGKRALMV
ncbi:MAG TPA: DNA gyrase C-terminal beta-propeller domain-containing protein, partial [Clostridia bacterium]|nr:DNA gyrase C-terminal beta-propeller domain-containing protein [Clostridia bacterium]